MAALNPILVYPASISAFTIVYYSSRDGEVTITRNDFSKNTKLNCLQYDGPSIQNIISAVSSSYPEPRLSEKQDAAEGAIYTVDFRPEKLYAYEIDGHSGSYGYLASLPPVVNESILYDSNGTFDANPIILDSSAYMYGERLTAVSGDQITVLSYIEPT